MTTPAMLDTAALKIVPITFPPDSWVKTMQLDTVVGMHAKA